MTILKVQMSFTNCVVNMRRFILVQRSLLTTTRSLKLILIRLYKRKLILWEKSLGLRLCFKKMKKVGRLSSMEKLPKLMSSRNLRNLPDWTVRSKTRIKIKNLSKGKNPTSLIYHLNFKTDIRHLQLPAKPMALHYESPHHCQSTVL